MKPILFNTEMVRAILDGRKTVTRRAKKKTVSPPCNPGDILYVRETWCDPSENWYHPILYKADFPMHYDADETECGEPIDLLAEDYTWKPSIHMPKDYARIFLRVTNVRLERLQDITPEQIDAEGCKEYAYSAETGELQPSKPTWFKILWDSTIKGADKPLYGWDANPWVWVIEFEKCQEVDDDAE